MLQILEESKDDLVAIRILGHVDKNDYDVMLPVLEERIKQHQKISIYAELQDVEAITLEALWEDLKFDIRHASDFEKAAIVGDQQWLELLLTVSSPFTSAQVKYFDFKDRNLALEWVRSKS
jgi:hypothetical protein